MRPRVALVVQRYGLEVNGGAEFLCRSIAELMKDVWDVTVFTTRALDHYTWANHYPEGLAVINGVEVQRFSVKKPRNMRKFNKLSEKIYWRPHSAKDELKWMKAQGPDAPGLIEKIKVDQDHFQVFIFFTYLYGTTYWSLPHVSHKSLLVPTAHDEPPIHLSLFNELFSQTKGFVFNSPEEKLFLRTKFNIDTSLSDVIGVGIRIEATIGSKNFCTANLPENYVIYVGRIDGSKGCPQLFDYWGRFKAKCKNNLELVLAGRPQMKVPKRKDIVSLGFLSEEEKFYAIAGARCLIMPSFFESLSIVLLEAWLCGRPVLVNGKCDVLKGQCRRSNGGLWYENYNEFEAGLNFLLNDQATASKMAANGKEFVESNYRWDQIKAKYARLVDQFLSAEF